MALAFAHAYASAFHHESVLLLVIEEPEAHLHPLAQEWLSRKIHDLARSGVQVLVTTHSPAFLDLLNLEGLVLVRKENGATRTIQMTKRELAKRLAELGKPKAAPETVLPFYATAATEEIRSGFFARKIVLVEGPTESLALPVYLERVGLNTTREGIAVIPVHGVGNLAKWWRLFTAYEIPTYVAFDNDKDDEKGEESF